MTFPILINVNGDYCGYKCPFKELRYSRTKCNLFGGSLETEFVLGVFSAKRSIKCKAYTESLTLADSSDKNKFTFS